MTNRKPTKAERTHVDEREELDPAQLPVDPDDGAVPPVVPQESEQDGPADPKA